MKFITEVEVTNDMIENLIVNSMEGGSNYWMEWISVPLKEGFKWDSDNYAMQIINGEVELKIYDTEEPEEFLGILNIKTIEKGLSEMSQQYPEDFNNIINENDDAETADIFMQLAIMGEIVYG